MKTLLNRYTVSPFFVFYLIHSNQVGIGILSFQRAITLNAGYDAWISVLLSGISISIVIWMMYRILKLAKNDLVSINQICFGKWIGTVLNVSMVLYFLTGAVFILCSYIELIHTWMFPLMKTWHISVILLLLIYYIVSGGFRIVTGMCFISVVLPLALMIVMLFLPLKYVKIDHFSTMFSHSFHDIILSSKTMALQFLGFEALFMYYPLIKDSEKSEKWAQWGLLSTIVVYLFVTLLTFGYFSEDQLSHIIWPTLTMIKTNQLPFIERFEYIVISLWLLIIIPNISLNIWAACRGVKRVFNMKKHFSLILFLALLFIVSELFDDRKSIKYLAMFYSDIGKYFTYFYIPLLFVIIHVRQFFKR